MTMRIRIAALFVSACLCHSASAQTPAPTLTRPQRELLKAIVTAVDSASRQPEATNLSWRQHVLRASDGSHYVAFTVEPPASVALPAGPALLYIRLATATPSGAATITERSPVREWLAGKLTDPRLLPRRNIAIGDMPAFGPSGTFGPRSSTASTGSNEMRLMDMERERARQERDTRDKQRRNEMEGKAAGSHDVLPFEDFDLASNSITADGARIITRALTAGPGDYDLYLAWGDPASATSSSTIRVLKKTLRLDPARTTGLITSSVILATAVSIRAAPYSSAEQASHPYSIGSMEIVPAASPRYRREQSLSAVFQVINAQSSETGMPDVGVNYRLVRLNGDRESPVASLTPQNYNATTLPADFNLRIGHPLFAAVTAPLSTLTRGDYRLKVVINDRVAGTAANAEADFSVIASPASLLTEAPPLGPAFTRESVLEAGTLAGLVDALAPSSPSPVLARALAIAKAGRLVELLVEEPVPAAESGVRTALTGLAFFSIGDSSAAAQFQRALQQQAPAAPTHFLIGAARAMQSRDPDAIAAWQAAIATGDAPPITARLLAEAFLRRNDAQHAQEVITAAAGRPVTPAWTRLKASIQIANRQEADAIALLAAHLAVERDDQEARWLLLHAVYAQYARTAKLTVAELETFRIEARAYLDANGANAPLAAEWLKAISSV